MSGKVSYKPGSVVRWRGRPSRIVQVVSSTSVLLEDSEGKEPQVVPVWELAAVNAEKADPSRRLLDALSEDDLVEAKRRFGIIKPLIHCERRSEDMVQAVAAAQNVPRATIYRWIKAYEGRRLMSDLAPRRKGRVMPKRLDARIEAVIADTIQGFYLTKHHPTVEETVLETQRRCRAAGLAKPAVGTIRSRIRAVDPKEKVLKREGRKAAHDKFGRVKDSFPGADQPLAVVQIDHTLLDVIVVDEVRRLPIGRPWLTLAIDVFSRMVAGYHLSLDNPSAFAVGLCLCHAMLDKREELERLGIKGEWPVWGQPRMVHADNGKDFRSHLIRDTLDEYGIRYEFRPPRTPHYGGHIERLAGTLSRKVHALPGATFSSPKQRGEYKSTAAATMTLAELQKWLVALIVGVYHNKLHEGIQMPPLARWNEGIVGSDRVTGRGLIDPVPDPRRLRLDFLPFITRTVQPEGIVWDKIWYRDPLLSQWVRASESGRRLQFKVRRDPTDISKLYFLDPALKDYVAIGYRDWNRPSISLWDYRAATGYLRQQGKAAQDEAAIFAAYDEMHRITEAARDATKKTRRKAAKRDEQRRHRAALTLDPPMDTVPVPVPVGPAPLPEAKPPPRARGPGRRGDGRLALVVDNGGKPPGGGDRDFDFSDSDVNTGVETW